MHHEQLAPDQIVLRGWLETNGDIGLAHAEVQLLVVQDELQPDVRIKIGELIEPRRQPEHAERHGRRHPQIAARFPARICQQDFRRSEFHEHVLRRAVEHFALLGEDKPARVPVKQRRIQLAFERADLPAHRRLAHIERLTRMGEAAGLGSRMENSELIPIHKILLC